MRICNPIHTLFRYIFLPFVGHFSNCKFSYSLLANCKFARTGNSLFPKIGADTRIRPYDIHFVTNYFTTQPLAGT